MTNSIAVFLGVTIGLCFAADAFLFDWAYTIVLMRRLLALIAWLAFWR